MSGGKLIFTVLFPITLKLASTVQIELWMP